MRPGPRSLSCWESRVGVRALALRPPDPRDPAARSTLGEIRRRDRLRGLLHEYHRAAAWDATRVMAPFRGAEDADGFAWADDVAALGFVSLSVTPIIVAIT
jgi:hypothetical protein